MNPSQKMPSVSTAPNMPKLEYTGAGPIDSISPLFLSILFPSYAPKNDI